MKEGDACAGGAPAREAERRRAALYSAAMPALAVTEAPVVGDEALMLAYATGDAAAFDALYARHKGGVYRYLVRHCGNAGVADELF